MKNGLTAPYYRAFFEGNRLRCAAAMLLRLVCALANLGFSWLLGEIFNAITKMDLPYLGRVCAATAGFLLLQAGLETLGDRVRSTFIHKALAQYKQAAFERIAQKNISAFARENTGRYLSALTNDASSVETNFLMYMFAVPYYALMLAGSLALMFFYSVPLSLLSLALSLLPLAASLPMSKELAKREKAMSDRNESFVGKLKDLLTGFSVIKSFKAEKEAAALFEADNGELERVKLRRRWWSYLLSDVTYNLLGLVMQMGVMSAGAYLAIRGRIAAGTVLIFTNLSNSVMQPINELPQGFANIRAARALIEKLAGLAEENASRAGEDVPARLERGIELSHVSFGYEKEKPVLRDVSLTLKAGGKYALVGASGCGKTTLLNLLMGGCEPYDGSVRIDGHELSGISPDSLYDLMSLIGQNVFLFDDTIERNVTMFREFPPERVQDAIARAGLSEVIARKGADYRCGEGGGGLSGGERQRVSIARCLLHGAPVLLLDEATAALDNQTAQQVTQAVLSLEGLTRLVVTHRLEASLLAKYDAIYVLRGGALCEAGTFDGLMAQKGYFYSLFNVSQ